MPQGHCGLAIGKDKSTTTTTLFIEQLIDHFASYGDMYVPSYQSFFYDVTEYQKYFTIDRINRYRQGSPRMLLQKKHPDIDPRVLILEPIEVCSLLNRKKLNAQEIMGRTHGIARGSDERVVSHVPFISCPSVPPVASSPALRKLRVV